MVRKLSTIADDIGAHWTNVNYGAVPYLDAMSTLTTVNDQFYADNGRSVVLYFLSNANAWRGPDAKRIKQELKDLLR